MKTKSVTNHRVEVTQADIAAWFVDNSEDADVEGMRLLSNKIADDTALVIAIPVSNEYLHTFLRSQIANLPAQGQYKVEILPNAANVVGIITWIILNDN